MSAGTRRRRLRRMNVPAASFNDTAMAVASSIQEKQARTEGQDYAALDRLIDSITRDFSRKGINSRLKALAKEGSSRNAATICDHRQTAF